MSLLFADIFEAIRYLRVTKGTTEKEIMNYVQERVGGCMSVGNIYKKIFSMVEYRYPLLEVVQAIDELRESRGSTNKEICDFVSQQGKNPNDPMKILKTIRTLNKLVEEGVLIKKGKRYVFPTKPPELADNTEEEEDCEGDENNNDEEEESEGDDEEEDDDDEENEEDNEGQDDDDDDDDDEEEDDDDDDDEEEEENEKCEGKDQIPETPKKQASCMIKTASKGLNKQKSFLDSGKPKATGNCNMDEERRDNISSKEGEDIDTKKNNLKRGRKIAKGQNYEAKSSGKNKGGEGIAFCARDFIDSQYSRNNTEAMPVPVQENLQDDPIITENCPTESLAKVFSLRRRESKKRKNRGGDDCRSRSPIRCTKNFYNDLKLIQSDTLRKDMVSGHLFQEMTDTPMDIDHDHEVVELDFDIMGHRSPIGGSSAPMTPGIHLDRTVSCCSQTNNKGPDHIKAEQDFDCNTQFFLKKNSDYKHSRHSMARAIDIQNKRQAAEKDKDKHNRGRRSEDRSGIKADRSASLCSVCEKKKRNS